MASILVVDDEEPLRDLLAIVFAEAGYHVLMAGDGQQALALIERERPDLVLSDVMMPILGGADLCRQLKAEPGTAAIPVILMTAGGSWHSSGAGADATLDKPFNLDDLERLVQRWLPLGS